MITTPTKPAVKPTESLAQRRAEFKAKGPDHFGTKDYLTAQKTARDLKLPLVIVVGSENDKQSVLTRFEKDNSVKGKVVVLRVDTNEAKQVEGGIQKIAKDLNFPITSGKGTPHVIAFKDANKELVLDKRPPFDPNFINTLRSKIGLSTDQQPGPKPKPKPGPGPGPKPKPKP